MIAGKVVLGRGYVLTIWAPKEDNTLWNFDLKLNGVPQGNLNLRDVGQDNEPVSEESLNDSLKVWLCDKISTSGVVEKSSNIVKNKLAKLVNKYRL